MSFAEGQIASDTMFETQDTPEQQQQQENVPDMMFAWPTRRAAGLEAV
jgi:hypothetical protein